jgi:hypothetical protein
MSLKNPVTPPGIDAGTVRIVAQRRNHYATPGPTANVHYIINTVSLQEQYYRDASDSSVPRSTLKLVQYNNLPNSISIPDI